MNENTIQFLNALSIKLGTTSEYLWAVLIKQAPIDGWITLMVMVAWLIGGFFLSKFFFGKIKNDKWDEEIGYCLFGFSLIVYAIVILIIGFCLSDTISSIINPEYWALNKILSSIKCK